MTSRRQFLGAAAAALSLSAVDETQAATDGGEFLERSPLRAYSARRRYRIPVRVERNQRGSTQGTDRYRRR